MTRIYQAVPLYLNQALLLSPEASHHLARVLRAQIGDQIIIFNGQGGEYQAVITKIDKKNVMVSLSAFHEHTIESPLGIHLAQGIAKGKKMDMIIQKAVELGVTTITPLFTERGNVHLTTERANNSTQHWQGIIQSAAEQSGRTLLPQLKSPCTLNEFITRTPSGINFVLSPHIKNKLPSTPLTAQTITLLIGPEGGLSNQELQQAQSANFIPLNLGPRILRTETASIAAISIIQARFGDMG